MSAKVEEVLRKLEEIHEFSEDHRDEWRNEVARDLNELMGRAVWWLETDGDTVDADFGSALLRTVQRVAEFDHIRTKEGNV